MELPLRQQGVMISAVRSNQRGGIERHLVAYLRFCFLNPADERELDVPGSFMRRDAPAADDWRPSELGHLPQHYYAHLMHAFQVVGYGHPDRHVRFVALTIYHMMVNNLHLMPEPHGTFERRLSEDRIAAGNVVS